MNYLEVFQNIFGNNNKINQWHVEVERTFSRRLLSVSSEHYHKPVFFQKTEYIT